MPINKELLAKVADAIEQAPQEFSQTTFGGRKFSRIPWKKGYVCETPCCIAGWTAIVANKRLYNEKVETVAAKAIFGEEAESSFGLFGSQWPTRWLPKGVSPERSASEHLFIPTAAEAVLVLRRIIAGELRID